jgi:hypothetical protein
MSSLADHQSPAQSSQQRAPLTSIINKQVVSTTTITINTGSGDGEKTTTSRSTASHVEVNAGGGGVIGRKENGIGFDEVGNSRPKPTSQQSCTLPINSCLSKHGFGSPTTVIAPGVLGVASIENSSDHAKSKKK